jgi:hypothetical protein
MQDKKHPTNSLETMLSQARSFHSDPYNLSLFLQERKWAPLRLTPPKKISSAYTWFWLCVLFLCFGKICRHRLSHFSEQFWGRNHSSVHLWKCTGSTNTYNWGEIIFFTTFLTPELNFPMDRVPGFRKNHTEPLSSDFHGNGLPGLLAVKDVTLSQCAQVSAVSTNLGTFGKCVSSLDLPWMPFLLFQ